LHNNGSVIIDDFSKANALNNHFISIFTNEDISLIPLMNGILYSCLPDITVSCAGVSELLSNLHPQKAAGPDGFSKDGSSRFSKVFTCDLAPMLTLIYQASLNQGSVPEDWKKHWLSLYLKRVTDQTLPITGLNP